MEMPVRGNSPPNADRTRRFEALYATHAARVLGYALRRASFDDAEEAVAQTFLTAWRRLDEVPADALPWLLAVARKVLANQQRSSRRRGALDLKLQAFSSVHVSPADEDPAFGFAANEMDGELLSALGRLPDREREALLLVAWDGLDRARAARALGCSQATLRLRLHRARRRLRGELEAGARFSVRDNAPLRRTRFEEAQ